MLGKWETKCLEFGGNLPQPTRKVIAREKYLKDILDKCIFVLLRVPFNPIKPIQLKVKKY